MAALASVLLCPPPIFAQQPDLLLTSATVARNNVGQDIAYLAWDSSTPGLLRGRVYALYAKPGAPGVAGVFLDIEPLGSHRDKQS